MIKIITGPANSGKSTKFLRLYEEDGDSIGLYSQKLYDEEKAIVGYNLVLLPDKEEEVPFIRLKESVCQNTDRYLIQGRFAFPAETFKIGERYILDYPATNPVWIDEIGALELKGLGYDYLIRRLLESNRDITFTIRDIFLEKVLANYRIPEYKLL